LMRPCLSKFVIALRPPPVTNNLSEAYSDSKNSLSELARQWSDLIMPANTLDMCTDSHEQVRAHVAMQV
jgi:hypothetical protein